MVKKLTLIGLLLCCSTLIAAPPAVDIPEVTQASSDYVIISPKTTAKSITYIGLSGVDPMPSAILADKNVFVLHTRGLKEGQYKFVGVATLNDEQSKTYFAVQVGKQVTPPTPIPPNPDPSPAPDPNITYDSPVWVFFVEDTGQRTPVITKVISDDAFWNGLTAKGYGVRFYNINSPDAKRMKFDSIKDASGKAFSIPFILITDKDGKPIGQPFAMPNNTADIQTKLPKLKG